MAAEEKEPAVNDKLNSNPFYLKKFRLYETPSNFYVIGSDKNRVCWRVLKIDRTETSELNIVEDPTSYSESECSDLLRRLREGNKPHGGLKFVTICYGIIGFVKFLGPYYMLIITQRRKLGTICGHKIYGVSKTKLITIPSCSNLNYSKDEKRYKKLLCSFDLTKDFYFSYSYHIMRSLQKNVEDYKDWRFVYETMFVWNEYLTRGIRISVKDNALWIVALVYGFFKQVDLFVCGRDFKFTLIARRSRHYAGTRYLKRGVNENGRVANDVETEQIVVDNAWPAEISSVVQIRGSIPLFWSQDSSIIKPDITLTREDRDYEATRLHFENLAERYGDPIIALNLIKAREKKPRETILRAEFANAVRFVNRGLEKENQLRLFQWDLHKHSRSNKGSSVLVELGNMAAYSLKLIGIFHCQVDREIYKPLALQRGVLRTNCIDCLDRTNVAQYAFGLVALGSQLHGLEMIDSPKIDLDDPLAGELMKLYETMGDTLSLQYGGSAAHNTIFSERRGQWKPAAQSQKFIRNVQRYYNNAYFDFEKQDSINVFLGHFQLPQPGKPALSKSLSDQHYYKLVRRDSKSAEEDDRLVIKRSLSDHENIDHVSYDDDEEECNFSNFMENDWLSSSGNSCEEERTEDSKKVANKTPIPKENEQTDQFPESFVNWVAEGGLLFYYSSNLKEIPLEIPKEIMEEKEKKKKKQY